MKRTAMTTRAEALKIGRYLGCSGAHETDDGWMPCADHSTLMEISNRAEKSLNSIATVKRRKKGKRSRYQFEELRERPVRGIDTLADGSLVSASVSMKSAQKKCPEATQSVVVNLRNRQKAIKDAKYGPLNPNESSKEYWKDLASDWDVSTAEAKKQRCGNCAAFVKTPEMLSCINDGIGNDRDSWSVINAGDLGYCEFFDFKCASKRTCSAWVVGGPITGTEKKQLSERVVRRSDPDVFDAPESARVRARQLGCIGIRQYSSTNGKPAWMPCTNESDYRRRMGTSEQGRIDIAKRQMREVRMAIGKMRTKSAAKTPAPKKDQIFGSSQNRPGSAASRSSASAIEFSDSQIAGLKRSMQTHNRRMDELNKPSWSRANLDALKAVYRRGAGAFSMSHRPNVTRSQWAMGRVRAFLWMLEKGRPKKLAYVTDNDLLPDSHPFKRSKKSAEFLLSDIPFYELEEKGLGKWFRGRRPNRMPNLRKRRSIAKRRPKSTFDGDGDGFIWNPTTGRDDLPFSAPSAPNSAIDGSAQRRLIMSQWMGRKKQRPQRSDIFKPKQGMPISRMDASSGDDDAIGNQFDELIKLNFGAAASKYSPVFKHEARYWARDANAQLLGNTWVRSDDLVTIQPVPDGLEDYISLRQWNGLDRNSQRTVKNMINAAKANPNSSAAKAMGKSPRQMDAILNRLAHASFAALFSRSDDGSISIDADNFNERRQFNLDRVRDAANFDYMVERFSPYMRFKIQQHFWMRDRNLENPSYGLGRTGFLSDREFAQAVSSMTVQTIRAINEQYEGISYDELEYEQVREILNELLYREGDTIARWRDFPIVADAVEDLLGVGVGRDPQRLEQWLREGAELELAQGWDEDEDAQRVAFEVAKALETIKAGFDRDVQLGAESDWFLQNPAYGALDDGSLSLLYKTNIESPPDNLPYDPTDPDWRPYIDPISMRMGGIFDDAGKPAYDEPRPFADKYKEIRTLAEDAAEEKYEPGNEKVIATYLDEVQSEELANMIDHRNQFVTWWSPNVLRIDDPKNFDPSLLQREAQNIPMAEQWLERQLYPSDSLGESYLKMFDDFKKWIEEVFDEYEDLLTSDDVLVREMLPKTLNGKLFMIGESKMSDALRALGLRKQILQFPDQNPFASLFTVFTNPLSPEVTRGARGTIGFSTLKLMDRFVEYEIQRRGLNNLR